ncbi:hypothetical protein Tco_0300905 [Tanacetum coccineum]
MGELAFFLGLQVKQHPDGIFISQDKYVADILKKFDFWTIKTATTPIESNKPLVKDEDGVDVDVHVYMSMIGSLMYLTASRPNIMFVVCACARIHLSNLKLTQIVIMEEPVLTKKSTTGGCQFLSKRLISWQCKKQTIMANSTTEAEYVAASNCCGQSTISVIKNPVAHSRTKHIEIRFHFIRDCYEKRLIEVIKIHTDSNVADLLTKVFVDSRESLEREIDGIEEFLSSNLLEFWLTKFQQQEVDVCNCRKSHPDSHTQHLSPTHLYEAPLETKPDPSLRPSSHIPNPDSNPEASYGNNWSVYDLLVFLCKQFTSQAKEIKALKAQVKKLKKKANPVISHHKAWLRATRLTKRRGVSKQGRKAIKSSKGDPTAHKDPAFNAFDDVDVDEAMDYKDAYYEERISAEKLSIDKPEVSTDQQDVSTDKQFEGTDKKNDSTNKQDGGTDNTKVSTDRQGEGTADQNEEKSVTQTYTLTPTPTIPTPTTSTPTIFGDDETIAQVLIIMSQNKEKLKEKEKGVEIRNAKETERPRPTSTRSILTLRPLPKIDPKDKGKKRIEEEDKSDTESEGITEAEKKFKQLANDEEVARKVQEEWEAEEEKRRMDEEEANKAVLIRSYDDIQARIDADRILAERLQEEEREQFTIEERAKLLHDTIAAQRRFLAQQRSEAIRNKPPTRNQLRNQMITYLKHVGGMKHYVLKTKNFEEIQVLYEKVKRSDESFIAIDFAEDERQIKVMNERAKDPKKKRVIKENQKEEDTAKVLAEHEVTEQGTKKRKSGHVKMIARKRPKRDEELRFVSEYLTTKPQYDETEEVEDVYLNVLRPITLEMDLSSTLKGSENSFIFPLGSLVVVGSSRLASVVLGQMANPHGGSCIWGMEV